MRTLLGLLLVNVGLVLAGLAVLAAIGQLSASVAGLVRALGLAFLVGLVAVGVAVIALLTVGVALRLTTAGLAGVAVLAGGCIVARRRVVPLRPAPRPIARTRPRSPDAFAALGFGIGFAVLSTIGLLAATEIPLAEYDAWSIWTRKAILLTEFDELPLSFYTSRAYAFMHPDYPILLPVLEALSFRAIGRPDTQVVHVELWLILVAGVWAFADLAARVTRAVVWGPLLLLVTVAPAVYGQALSGYADVPMAVFLGLGALALGLWLQRGDGRDLALAVILLAGAANMKNEGLTGAVALFAAAFAVRTRQDGRRSLRSLVLGAAVLAVLVAPWRLWLTVHGIAGDLRLSQGLDPGFLVDRLDRVWPALAALQDQLADQDAWRFLLPIGLATVAACLLARVARPLASFYLSAGLLAFGFLVWAYWISPLDIDFHLATSAGRVIAGVVFVGVAAALHLAGALGAAGAPPGADTVGSPPLDRPADSSVAAS